jgi:hypothetical protein
VVRESGGLDMSVKRERIVAVDEQGRDVDVVKHTPIVPTPTLMDSSAFTEGLPEFRLSDGSHVNVNGSEFVVVATGRRLVRKKSMRRRVCSSLASMLGVVDRSALAPFSLGLALGLNPFGLRIQ